MFVGIKFGLSTIDETIKGIPIALYLGDQFVKTYTNTEKVFSE